MIIKMMPFNKIKGYIGIYMKESPHEIDVLHYKTIKKVAWAVNQASKYTPWESKCLVQALTAQNMLKRRKIYSTLYLGVAKKGSKNINAHAWLRCGQVIVTGGYRREDFKEVAKFSNDVLT
ncbi:lasso peptide biosynthesis B2 protein [Clostridium polyendosporum]|nr:lasso peptide biosynthesis B2 protein [Clostridium polyendosporum]